MAKLFFKACIYAICYITPGFDMNYNLETNIRPYTWLSICNGPQNLG